jgi:hypothetical protein
MRSGKHRWRSASWRDWRHQKWTCTCREGARSERQRQRSDDRGDSSRVQEQKASASTRTTGAVATTIRESEASGMACSRSSMAERKAASADMTWYGSTRCEGGVPWTGGMVDRWEMGHRRTDGGGRRKTEKAGAFGDRASRDKMGQKSIELRRQ